MRALVISGGGSKGAFAGGVAQYLMEVRGNQYDLLLGTSTGSLLLPHLALGEISKIYNVYTNVNKDNIFDVSPFVIKQKEGVDIVTINHFNVIKQFAQGKRTFGESRRLLKYIKDNFSLSEFNQLKASSCDIVVTVTNITLNQVEYKCIRDYDYEEFCEWIWISCNYVPFMSLVTKGNYEYGDGGFSNLVPITEAINRGATEVDVIILETEAQTAPRVIGKNPFSLMLDLFGTLLDQVEKHDIAIGKLTATSKNVKLNLFYTPTKLTDNALIFNRNKMKEWWHQGYEYAQNKNEDMSDYR